MTLAAITAELISGEWAMEENALRALVQAAESLDLSRITPPADAPQRLSFERRGSLAVVHVNGTLMKRVPQWAKWIGANVTETSSVARAVSDAAADAGITAIALQVDSPGGQVAGMQEAAAAIHAARASKPVHAVVESLAASGGYWLASQAESITAPADAKVGSIGVYTVAVDESARAEREGVKVHVIRSGPHKGAGEPGAPITGEHLAATQSVVDGLAELFVADVARGRGVSPDKIKPHATGRVWLAAEAQKLGLVDQVEPVSAALSRMAPTKEAPMAEQQNKPDEAEAKAKAAIESERARVKAITDEFAGKDQSFALAQIAAGSTLEQAKLAYLPILEKRLADQAKALEEKAPVASPAPQGGATPLPRGGDPAESKALGFMDAAAALAADKGVSLLKAMSEVAKKNPGLHEAFKAECAAKGPQHHARKRALGI